MVAMGQKTSLIASRVRNLPHCVPLAFREWPQTEVGDIDDVFFVALVKPSSDGTANGRSLRAAANGFLRGRCAAPKGVFLIFLLFGELTHSAMCASEHVEKKIGRFCLALKIMRAERTDESSRFSADAPLWSGQSHGLALLSLLLHLLVIL
jgi:hypothetical protein